MTKNINLSFIAGFKTASRFLFKRFICRTYRFKKKSERFGRCFFPENWSFFAVVNIYHAQENANKSHQKVWLKFSTSKSSNVTSKSCLNTFTSFLILHIHKRDKKTQLNEFWRRSVSVDKWRALSKFQFNFSFEFLRARKTLWEKPIWFSARLCDCEHNCTFNNGILPFEANFFC